jgi:hypothetical protein
VKIFRFILLLGLFGCLQVICSEKIDSDSSASDSEAVGIGKVKSPNIVILDSYDTAVTNAFHALADTNLEGDEKQAIIDEAVMTRRVELEDLTPAGYRKKTTFKAGVRRTSLYPDDSGDKYYVGYSHDGHSAFYLPSAEAEIDGAGYDLVGINMHLTEESIGLAAAATAAAKATPPAGLSVRKLPCGHAYHVGCINRSFTSCGSKCPACTLPASKKDMVYVHPRWLTGVRDGKCYSGSSVDCICGDVIIGAKDKGDASSLKKHSRAGGSVSDGGGSAGGAGDGARKARITTGGLLAADGARERLE